MASLIAMVPQKKCAVWKVRLAVRGVDFQQAEHSSCCCVMFAVALFLGRGQIHHTYRPLPAMTHSQDAASSEQSPPNLLRWKLPCREKIQQRSVISRRPESAG